jgi:hypothetical protein
MTTNVFDGAVGMLATDSRWSVQHGRWLKFIDDTNFDKVEIFKSTAFMFAGKGQLIQEWKNWIRTDPQDDSGQPAVEGISINGFDIPTKRVRYTEGKSISHESSIFAGSGARHAVLCWRSNRDAVKSVETAKLMDPASGGAVKYYEFSTGNTNLKVVDMMSPNTIEQVDKVLALKGTYMDLTTRQSGLPPFKLSQVAASDDMGSNNDQELAQLDQKLAAGELSANAPCDAMYSEWTPEAKGELKSFLGSVFGWTKN